MSLRNTSKTVAAIRKAVVPHPTVKAPWQWGVVDSFTTTPPLTCNIYINGTQNLNNPAFLTKNVRYLESFVPYKGAVVLIGHGTGGLVSDRVIIGDLAGQNVPIHGTITEITSVGGTISVTDPSGPVVNLENAGVTQIIAGTNVTISPADGTGAVTVNSTGGGGGITDITSSDASVGITDPTGPTTDLSVNWGSFPGLGTISGPEGFVTTDTNVLASLVITPSYSSKTLNIGQSIGGSLVGELDLINVVASGGAYMHWVNGGPSAAIDLYFDPAGGDAAVGNVFTITTDYHPGVGTYVGATWAPPAAPPLQIASLTGPGRTATPGDLTQTGGFTVNEAGITGINLNDSGSGGMIANESGTGPITIWSTNTANTQGVAIVDRGSGGINIVEGGTGAINIQNNPATTGAGGIGIGDYSTGGVFIQYNTAGLLSFYGAPTVVQPAAISSPSGGATVDTEARTAITSILAVLGAAAGGLGLTA